MSSSLQQEIETETKWTHHRIESDGGWLTSSCFARIDNSNRGLTRAGHVYVYIFIRGPPNK